MSPELHAIRRLFVAMILVLIAVWVFTVAQSYEGRARLVESSRVSCEHTKLDRVADARGWWIAEEARMDTATDPRQQPHARSSARNAAEQYGALAAELEARSSINCTQTIPGASLWPF
jgi:hypothetical protein